MLYADSIVLSKLIISLAYIMYVVHKSQLVESSCLPLVLLTIIIITILLAKLTKPVATRPQASS